MNISPRGLRLIKDFEGCRLTAYRDAGGVWTIGYGSTGRHVRPGLRISAERAEKLLIQDVLRFEIAVDRLCVDVPTTQAQFDAMVSLAFNIGTGAFAKSTVARMHRAGRYGLAGNAFLLWVRAGRRRLTGLIRRRRAERALYLS